MSVNFSSIVQAISLRFEHPFSLNRNIVPLHHQNLLRYLTLPLFFSSETYCPLRSEQTVLCNKIYISFINPLSQIFPVQVVVEDLHFHSVLQFIFNIFKLIRPSIKDVDHMKSLWEPPATLIDQVGCSILVPNVTLKTDLILFFFDTVQNTSNELYRYKTNILPRL